MIKKYQTQLPEYSIWKQIKYRCLNPTNRSYHNYGGRGITICKEWLDFSTFYNDVGKRPSTKYSIDRIDNNKGYSKGNVKWSTKKEQNDNRRMSIWLQLDGKKMVLKDWAKLAGITDVALKYRLNKGMTLRQAISLKRFTMPQQVLIEYKGEKMNIKDWSKKLGISDRLLSDRISRWKDIDKCFTTPVRKIIKL